MSHCYKNKVDLTLFSNKEIDKGASPLKRTLWYFVNAVFFKCYWNISSGLKVWLLELFGANIGIGVTVKPNVNIKRPWRLTIANHVWIGEGVWIDNNADVVIESNCVISQGAMLLCGNHNYKKKSFDSFPGSIIIEEGAWICAKAIVAPGVTIHTHAVLGVGSITTKDLEAYTIYQGNPATEVRKRIIED